MVRHSIILIVLFLAPSAFAERAKLPALAIPDALGVNIHFTDPRPGEMKMLAEGGFKWVRMDFSWGGTEREKGKYNFAAYDRLMDALGPHGIRAVFILDYSNRLYDDGVSPHTEEARAAMAAWATVAVRHFAGKGVVWEMWNEPNIKQFWKPQPSADDYAKLALAVGKAIRAAAPDELHVGPATSTIDLKFLETCFQAGCLEWWDAVSVHPYRQQNPETAGEDYRKLRLLIDKYAPAGKVIPILSGEWGYSAGWGKFDVELQGKYLPREFLTNLYNQVPISIWYDWHDDGVDPTEPEHHFGTVGNAYKKDAEQVYEPKPAYLTARALTQQLGGFVYNKRLATGNDGDWVLVFMKGDQVRMAAWTTSTTPHDVVIPMRAGAVAVFDLKGEAVERLKADEKGATIRVSDSVQYLVPQQ
jgi:polysaccharide biosynthesis protein PslG